MTITPTTLTRVAGVAAAAAGAIFVGVQIGHPHLDVDSITTTEVVIRNSAKVAMAVLALVGITGMYLSQVRRNGLLGLAGYAVLAAGYLTIAATSIIAAYVLPALADSNPSYVADVLTVSKSGTPNGDVGALAAVWSFQGYAYLAGGLLFGIALFRAEVLTRWATILLAAGGVISIALSLMPDAFYRLLAFPNGIAMVALGFSLYRTTSRVNASDGKTPARAHVAPVIT